MVATALASFLNCNSVWFSGFIHFVVRNSTRIWKWSSPKFKYGFMLRRIHHYWPSVTTYFPRILVLLFKFDPIHYEMRLIKNCSNKDFNLLRWSVIKGWSFPYSIKGNKIYHVATWFYWSVCIIWSSKNTSTVWTFCTG